MAMSPPVVEFFSDLHCPHAYLTRYRLRSIEEGLGGVRFQSRCLSLELDLENPTPKHIVDQEAPFLATLEEGLPYRPWPEGKTSRWPVTFLPAFEAVKAAETLDVEKAWALDWRIRTAFYRDHACVSMRHVLAGLAEGVGLDRSSFLEAFDEGFRARVVQESTEGWYGEGFTHSPSFRLPDGSTIVNPGGHWTRLDPEEGHRLVSFDPGHDDEAERLDALIRDAVASA